MYQMGIVLSTGEQIGLQFKTELHCNQVANQIRDAIIENTKWILVDDDYSRKVFVRIPNVIGTNVSDVAETLSAGGEVAILQTRAQIEAQNRANNDPKLKFMSGVSGLKLQG